jgi:hypothetical protein
LAVLRWQFALVYSAVPDPGLQAIYREMVPHGVYAQPFKAAIKDYRTLIADMEESLADNRFSGRQLA